MDHRYYMQKTIALAQQAVSDIDNHDVPVAAILVDEAAGILAEAVNSREQEKSILAHAEINVMQKAASIKNSWNLSGTTLYVTLEPCAMCAGAILQSHISRVVFAAYEPKTGALGSRYNLVNSDLEVIGGVMEEAAAAILKDFFLKLRN